MDRWSRSSLCFLRRKQPWNPHAGAFQVNGAAKQLDLHTVKIKTKSLGGLRSFQPPPGKKIASSNLDFSWLECCFSLHLPCRAGEEQEMVSQFQEDHGADGCLQAVTLWGLDVGAMASSTSPREGKGHGGCPKWPPLVTLSFEDHGGLCPASVHKRLGFTAGSREPLGVCIFITNSMLTAVSPSSSLLPQFAPCSGTKPKSPSAPQTPPGWLKTQTQQMQTSNAEWPWEPKLGALLLIRGLVWRRRRDPCSSPNFNHS